MIDDIRALTARLADEPGSLAFMELAEALRHRGQLDAAYKVARGGVQRYPGLADAHDLLARVLSDKGDLAGAFDSWATALQVDPMRTSALKGIAFLYYRAGEPAAALEHLQRALDVDPDDRTITQAIARLGPAALSGAASATRSPSATLAATPLDAPGTGGGSAAPTRGVLFEEVAGGAEGLLLVDAQGLRLAGALVDDPAGEAGDRVAAQLAGVSREAARATRLLGLGAWHSIAIESPDGHLFLTAPSAETVLLVARDRSVPPARVALLAERAARVARGWLEGQE